MKIQMILPNFAFSVTKPLDFILVTLSLIHI